MSKKKKTLMLLIILIIVLVAVLIARSAIEKNREENTVFTSLEQCKTPKDVIKYMGSEYIKQEDSIEEDFSIDIYLKFKVNLYTNNQPNKDYYYELMDNIAYVLDYKSFRLIDDEKQLLISVVCDSENGRIKKKYINGDNNYFGNEESNKEFKEMKKTNKTDMQINSIELADLINNNWKLDETYFGNKTKTLGKYDIYGDRGIEVRRVYKKIFNIVFTEAYTGAVINGIKPGMEKQEIVSILGTPTIQGNDEAIFGYKGEYVYVFFTYGEISVYRVEEYDSTSFAKLVEKYINGMDVKTFVSSITDIWPDYDQYNYDSNFVNLIYTLKGIKIQFNITANHGVIVYNNYEGQITEGKTIEELNTEELKDKVYFENTNTMLENEAIRAEYYEANPE